MPTHIINKDANSVTKIKLSEGYSIFVSSRGNTATSRLLVYVTGYYMGIQRSFHSFIDQGDNDEVYISDTETSTLYIKNTLATAISVLSIYGNVTLTSVSSLPSSGITKLT